MMILSREKGSITPERFSTEKLDVSNVVKRLRQTPHSRRRLIVAPSSITLVSTTRVSSCWQKGQRKVPSTSSVRKPYLELGIVQTVACTREPELSVKYRISHHHCAFCRRFLLCRERHNLPDVKSRFTESVQRTDVLHYFLQRATGLQGRC